MTDRPCRTCIHGETSTAGSETCAPCIGRKNKPNWQPKTVPTSIPSICKGCAWTGPGCCQESTAAPSEPKVTGTRADTVIADDLSATLAQRGGRYGVFQDQARYADQINDIFHSSPNWKAMQPDQREALRMFANKLGRILNGDPNYDDSWVDIAGYSTLIVDRLRGNPH